MGNGRIWEGERDYQGEVQRSFFLFLVEISPTVMLWFVYLAHNTSFQHHGIKLGRFSVQRKKTGWSMPLKLWNMHPEPRHADMPCHCNANISPFCFASCRSSSLVSWASSHLSPIPLFFTLCQLLPGFLFFLVHHIPFTCVGVRTENQGGVSRTFHESSGCPIPGQTLLTVCLI